MPRASMRLTGLIVALYAGMGMATLARAQSEPRHFVSIGSIRATKTCTTYLVASGRSSLSVNRNSLHASDQWRTWLVKDCVKNFATMRSSMEAALASSGNFTIGGGGYKVDLVVSDVGDRMAATANTPGYDAEAYETMSGAMFVNIDVTIRDRLGRVVYGGVLTKSIPMGSTASANEFSTAQMQDGEGVYGVLQHEAALAAARVVIFHIAPIRVTGRSGNQVRLSYGQPLLPVGTLVEMRSRNGFDDIKYRVTSASNRSAIAEKEGDGDPASVEVGSSATFIEADDPAANGRRTKREELP